MDLGTKSNENPDLPASRPSRSGRQPRAGDQTASGPQPGKQPATAPLLIHIGFHKCGSTWLQQELFNHQGCGFTDATDETRQQIIMRIGMPDPLFYDPGQVASCYAGRIEAARKAGLTMVLSHEQLSGHPSAGGRDRCMIAERLNASFPDARILIVFREQRALIRSMYSQHITAGGVESLRRWLSTPEPGCGRKPSFTFEFYEFDRLIEYYRDLFGPDRVLALPLEMLSQRPDEFTRRITGFCGRQPAGARPASARNTRRPQLMQLIQRPMNMLFFHNDLSPGALVHIPRFHNRWAKLRPLFDRLSPPFLERWLDRRQRRAIDENVGNRYTASNRRTQDITGLSLADLGYPVE